MYVITKINIIIFHFLIVLSHAISGQSAHVSSCSSDQQCMDIIDEKNNVKDSQTSVLKYVLDNGFTVLVKPVDTQQDIAIELYIRVGAKHEESNQKGIAHLIEHMLFKGTEKLSESDIWLISDKLAGGFNAFTSHDFTKMVCSFPISAWRIALPILADCMSTCAFKQDHLNSELKTVVQELKMYQNDFSRTLMHAMMSSMYVEHPYRYPVVGYKQNIWNADVEMLKTFYQKHYIPSNAMLVVVGNVNPDEVFNLAQIHFGSLKNNQLYIQPDFYLTKDLKTQKVVIYRDVAKPIVQLAFMIPGLREKQDMIMEIVQALLIEGKTSRLYKKLIDSQLVDSLDGWNLERFESDIFFISFQPSQESYCETIIKIILNEFENIAQQGCSHSELKKIFKTFLSRFYSYMECNKGLASAIGQYYLATNDENYIYHQQEHYHLKKNVDFQALNETIKEFVGNHFRLALMHEGYVLPIPFGEQEYWNKLQQRSDEEDSRILSGKIRNSSLEPGSYVHTIEDAAHTDFVSPNPHVMSLKNGIKVISYHTDAVPKIEMQLLFKDVLPRHLKGKHEIISCLSALLHKIRTKKRSADDLDLLFENSGIDIDFSVQGLSASLISDDLEYALPLLFEMTTDCCFDEETLAKVKTELISSYEASFDDEEAMAWTLSTSTVYHRVHDSSHEEFFAAKMKRVTLDDINEAYNELITPDGAKIIIVGNIGNQQKLYELLNKEFGSWQGSLLPEPQCDAVQRAEPTLKTYYIERDQLNLMLVGPSISRTDPDYEALLLYDRHLNSRLFSLRERTGAFYTIHGSIMFIQGWERGISFIKTLISLDSLNEVRKLFSTFIQDDIEAFTEEDLKLAKKTRLKEREQLYVNNGELIHTFNWLDTYDLPFSYLDTLDEKFKHITVEDVKNAVKRVFDVTLLSNILVGRVGERDTCFEQSLN